MPAWKVRGRVRRGSIWKISICPSGDRGNSVGIAARSDELRRPSGCFRRVPSRAPVAPAPCPAAAGKHSNRPASGCRRDTSGTKSRSSRRPSRWRGRRLQHRDRHRRRTESNFQVKRFLNIFSDSRTIYTRFATVLSTAAPAPSPNARSESASGDEPSIQRWPTPASRTRRLNCRGWKTGP